MVCAKVACLLPTRRIGKRAVGPAVSFTADVLLPTSFFGPALATYVLVLVIIKVSACSCAWTEGVVLHRSLQLPAVLSCAALCS